MKRVLQMLAALLLVAAPAHAAPQGESLPMSQPGAHQFTFTSIDGQPMPLSAFAGQVLLIVNTASQCGFTGQYKGLQALHEKLHARGLTIIGVPCNDFGGQEPGDEKIIKDFTSKQFGVTFPLTAKTAVSGKDAHPFFTWAAAQKKGAFLQSSPKWNFHKFLIGRDGQLVKSYGSQITPEDPALALDIEALLAAPISE